MPRLAVTVLMLALLAATGTAFALTEVLKLEGSPVARPKFHVSFSPGCTCPQDAARLRVRMREDQTVDAVIVDGDGNVVRMLATGRAASGPESFVWDGRDDEGAVVPDGTYRLRLTFEEAGRTITIPNGIRVDTEPPELSEVGVSPMRIELGEESLTVTAHSDERARLVLYVDARRVARGPLQDAGVLRLSWNGTAKGRALEPGKYQLTVRARDPASNISDASEGMPIEIVRPVR